MIARVLALGRSFKKLVSYLKTGKDARQRERDRVEWVEFRNLPTRNPDTAACMMAAAARESVSGTKEPVYHFSVSCDPNDPVNPSTLRGISDRLIRDLGLEEYQVLIFAHKDRAHPHLHFVVNRVHPDRHTLWRTWKGYSRIERSLRAQEQELGLRIVPGWNSVVVRSEDGGLRVPAEHETGLQRVYPRSGPRRGSADFLREVTARAAPVLEQARSWAELERGLAEQGLTLRAKGGGFTLTDGTHQVKASEVGRGCSRYHLEKRLGAYPDYRARMAVAEIGPAPIAPVNPPEPARPQDPPPVQATASAQPESPAQALPSAPQAPPHGVDARVPTRHRPQFGDAGHGIHELFGTPPSREGERATPAVQRNPTPQPQRSERAFLREVQERAGPVLEQAVSWPELERGLADRGMALREKGAGFVVTDGEREVKASEVGRAFSRFHLEKRLGRYQDSRAQGAVGEVLPVTPAPAPKPDPATRQPEQLALPLSPLHLPEPEERRVTVPAPDGLSDRLPPLPPVARVQRDVPAPAAPPAVPRDTTPTQPPERTAIPPRPAEPSEDGQLAIPFAETSPPASPVTPTLEPATDLSSRTEPPRAASHVEVPRRAEPLVRGLEPGVPIAPEPVQVEPPRQPSSDTPSSPPVPPDLPESLRDLVLRGAAIEETERLIQEASKEVHAAVHALEMISEWTKQAEAVRYTTAERLRQVYADPNAAHQAITAFRHLNGDRALLSAVSATPEQFGELRWERARRIFGFRRDTSKAEKAVPLLAVALEQDYATAGRAPSPGEHAAAQRRVHDARHAMDAAQQTRRALPPGHSIAYRREFVELLRSMAAEVPGGTERLARLVTTTIPTAARFVAGALKAAHDKERRREREQGRGIDI